MMMTMMHRQEQLLFPELKHMIFTSLAILKYSMPEDSDGNLTIS